MASARFWPSLERERYLVFSFSAFGLSFSPLMIRELVSGHSKQPLRVEIRGFKTGHYLGVKTALVGPITAGPEGHVECP
jgi:hypothetical protein